MRSILTGKIFTLAVLGLVLAGCEQVPFVQRSGRYPGTTVPPSTACYALEPGVTAQVDLARLRHPSSCTPQFEGRTYVRLRQELKISKGKIREGQGAHPQGDCNLSYYGSLREVGFTTTGERVFWASENYKREDLRDFILLYKREEGNYYYFDVYIDKTKDVPDFVKNCQERGGLIPVIEGLVLPPQVFSLEGIEGFDCDNFSCLTEEEQKQPEFDQNKDEFKPFYVKISEVDSYPDEAALIGTLTATGTEGTKTYNVRYHADTMYLKEVSGATETGKVHIYNPTDEPPPKPTGRQPTLQLKALKFISTAVWTWATPECKPVIYLYPQEVTKLSIKLNPDGYLTESQPLYQNGWEDIVAYPDGKLIYQGEVFESLHYEAIINKFRTPKEGWVVQREDLSEFFAEILPKLGLNEKESEDFQEYWLGRLTSSPYFFIGPLSREEIERIEPIEFSVQPNTFIRLRFYFKGLDEPFEIDPPVLPPPILRAGFTVVEWGGLFKD